MQSFLELSAMIHPCVISSSKRVSKLYVHIYMEMSQIIIIIFINVIRVAAELDLSAQWQSNVCL